ncbi:MAG: T9SS type A sorting domain-containing protein [Saprospiraceae bacterium]|nr:T9SS type A sorting domain-containing protein [Saprospiraceae bacterium]
MKRFLQLSILFIAVLYSSQSTTAQDVISITEAREIDAEGSLIRLNQNVELTGIAIGPNFRGGGQTWVLYDIMNSIGITVFAFNNDVGYDVTDGDELRVVGELAEFNGLAEIIPTSITIVSQGNVLPDPIVVTALSEMTEANLVTIENVSLADPSQWGTGSFNVDITDGTNTFQARIDSDINISGMPAPQGTFNITGIGGQFDGSAPYDEGYQLFPRSTADIDPYDTGVVTGPTYEKLTMPEAREIDADFLSTRTGDKVEVTGIVHGINFRPSGLQFSLIDDNNVGIGIFSSSDQLGYTFQEADNITVFGTMAQFNGLIQINPDSIVLNSSNNLLQIPIQKPTLDETTESSMTSIIMAGWVNSADWLGDGSSFNIDFNSSTGEVLTMRIDSDTELASMPIPDGFSIVTGIGGQFDSSAPHNEGYQLFPWKLTAFEPYLSTDNPYQGNINIFPNPVNEFLNIEAEDNYENVQIFDMSGRLIINAQGNQKQLNVSNIDTGLYTLRIAFKETVHIQKVLIN